MSLVLASTSASRQAMLRAAGVVFQAVAPEIDEDAAKAALGPLPGDVLAARLAELKAVETSRRHPDGVVLGADQVLLCDGRLYSKATTRAEARAVLRSLAGRQHRLVSAAVLARNGEALWRTTETADLWMRDFSDHFLDAYLDHEGEGILSGVGCYRIEDYGAQLFSRTQGDHFVIRGLPLLAVLAALRTFGELSA